MGIVRTDERAAVLGRSGFLLLGNGCFLRLTASRFTDTPSAYHARFFFGPVKYDYYGGP